MSDSAGLSEVREEFLQNLKQLAAEMDPQGPYFFGPEPSLIDFVVAPWVVSPEPTPSNPPPLPFIHIRRFAANALDCRCVSGSSTTTKADCRCRRKGKNGSA